MRRRRIEDACQLPSPRWVQFVGWCAFALSCGCAVAAAPAGQQITDGADGVSCKYLVLGARMAWQQPGGDWTDSAGVDFGPAAYATVQLPRSKAGQAVDIDVTALARAWQEGAVPTGAIFLAGSGSGRIRVHSRESDEAGMRPVLRVAWQDGRTDDLPAIADATLHCGSIRGLGEAKNFAVGRETNAVMAFAFKVQPGRVLKSAKLGLVIQSNSPSATISVFRPIVPSAQVSAPVAGLSGAFPKDAGIAKHPAVVYAERFETEDWQTHMPPSSKSNASLTGPRANGDFVPLDGRALKATIPKGKNQALNAHFRFAKKTGQEPEDMYFRYALRLGDNWDPGSSGGKLPGFSGTYGRAGWGGRKSNGSNGWVTQGAFMQQHGKESAFSDLRAIGSYVYHADMKGNYGNQWGWNLGSGGMLHKDRWYSIEQHVRMNTPGRNDGVLQAWIDGVLVFERSDLRFRDIPDLKIESLWMNVWYGGTDPAPQDMDFYIDNLVIARQYIGPVQGLR